MYYAQALDTRGEVPWDPANDGDLQAAETCVLQARRWSAALQHLERGLNLYGQILEPRRVHLLDSALQPRGKTAEPDDFSGEERDIAKYLLLEQELDSYSKLKSLGAEIHGFESFLMHEQAVRFLYEIQRLETLTSTDSAASRRHSLKMDATWRRSSIPLRSHGRRGTSH